MICAACTETIEDTASCPHCGESPTLEGRYRLLGVLGTGSQATTYKAERIEDGEIFAVKEALVRKLESAKAFQLFDREAAVLKTLRHHGIPRYVEDFSCGEGRSVGLYLVQEFVEGLTLEQELTERRFNEKEVRDFLIEVLDILQYLHRLTPPVIHRDIKPSNLIRRAGDDRLALIDFGAVRDVMRARDGAGSTVAGTFGYMAPEQFAGSAVPASDIYALGATAVALLSRQDPARLLDAGSQRLGWRSAIQVGPHTRSVLERMLAPVVEQRASDAGALLRELLDGRVLPVLSGVPPRPAPLVHPPVHAPARPLVPPAPAPPSGRRAMAMASNLVSSGMAMISGGRIARYQPPPATMTVVDVPPAPRDLPLAVHNSYIGPRAGLRYLAGAGGGYGLVVGVGAGAPVAALALFALLVLQALHLLAKRNQYRRNLRRVLRDGVRTTGRVLGQRRRGRGYEITFEYDVAGHRRVATSRHHHGRTLPVGSAATVLYLQASPDIAHVLVPEPQRARRMLR